MERDSEKAERDEGEGDSKEEDVEREDEGAEMGNEKVEENGKEVEKGRRREILMRKTGAQPATASPQTVVGVSSDELIDPPLSQYSV